MIGIKINKTLRNVLITTAVIVGTSPGSKYDKALKLGIPIWNEEEFISNLGGSYERMGRI